MHIYLSRDTGGSLCVATKRLTRPLLKLSRLSVGLGDSLDLVLLLDGERVGALLGAVHDLISQTLGGGLDVSEGAVAGTLGDERDGLVDSSQGRNVNGLSSDNTARTDSGGILSGTSVLDGVDEDLNRVLVGQEVNDLEGLLDDADRQLLLTVVSTLHHHRVDESLNDGAGGLSETLLLITASGVGQVHSGGVLEGDVILQW